ncbi:rhomboid domain-containing protein 3 isoform X2 [Synchiropus splendidus]|uniref:rhomboid domain-containing protein 3 isoform X2 n=1 Tax=Synchiropus splendidus TaxID=270530 RepID=UPI00237ED643|nr:rhomboid domain-containing protein 3 isoform X2 [Synchiropus splendidus]
MRHRSLLSPWSRVGPDGRGFCLGTCAVISTILVVHAAGVQASLSLGPGAELPSFREVFLYALSHDDLPSLLVSVGLLLLAGPSQERRWGTAVFLALSILTTLCLPLVYALVLFVLVGEPSRVCGYSAIEMALLTAQCRQVTPRRLFKWVPVWFLPWCLLLLGMLLLPGTPALLHFCAISVGHNYSQSLIKALQELRQLSSVNLIPRSSYISTSAHMRLPTHHSSARSTSSHQMCAAPLPVRDPAIFKHQPWWDQVSSLREELAPLTEAEQLEEQMLRAAMLESLQDAPEDAKIEVPKSSVSSLRLQQLEKMGFPTDKAVVALAASKQLDGAISLLIDDSVGEQAVVVSEGKRPPTRQSANASSC